MALGYHPCGYLWKPFLKSKIIQGVTVRNNTEETFAALKSHFCVLSEKNQHLVWGNENSDFFFKHPSAEILLQKLHQKLQIKV